MAIVMLEIVMREQNLSNGEIENAKKPFVRGHQPGLADGGAGLQFGEVSRASFVPEHTHAGADRAGTDKHNFLACLALFGDLRYQLLHLRQIGLLAAVGQNTSAELDDDAGDVFQEVRARGICFR
jgi:hypothetical protein